MKNRYHQHIVKQPGICGGRACIAGYRIRVMDIVAWHELRHKSAEEIVTMFPGLTLPDVDAALAYYLEHREEIDQDFRQDEQAANEMIARHPSNTKEEEEEERWQKQLARITRLGDARKLTKEQVSELEARIDQDPDDPDIRIQLFGYYGRSRADKMEKDGFCRQVLWFIDNHPEHYCASESFIVPKTHYNKVRKHWLKQVEAHTNEPKILAHAGNFLARSREVDDFKLGIKLLGQASELEPDEPAWLRDLTSHLQRGISYTTNHDLKAEYAKDLLKFGERRMKVKDWDAMQKWFGWAYLAYGAVLLNDFDKAREFSGEFCKNVVRFKGFEGHVDYARAINGLIALRENELDLAKKCLTRLPHYNTTLQLMRELCDAGATDAVLEYIDDSLARGEFAEQKVAEWKTLLAQDKIPEFEGEMIGEI